VNQWLNGLTCFHTSHSWVTDRHFAPKGDSLGIRATGAVVSNDKAVSRHLKRTNNRNRPPEFPVNAMERISFSQSNSVTADRTLREKTGRNIVYGLICRRWKTLQRDRPHSTIDEPTPMQGGHFSFSPDLWPYMELQPPSILFIFSKWIVLLRYHWGSASGIDMRTSFFGLFQSRHRETAFRSIR
jgi:hypothetical protein